MNKINVGISFLKVAAMYGVVLMHFGTGGSMLVHSSVPIFMLTSFYLSGAKLSTDWMTLGNRIKRLYVPFAFWGSVYSLLLVLHEGGDLGGIWMLQMLIGVPACPPLYFMSLLMLITVVLFLAIRFSGRKVNWVLAVICSSALLMQYLGLNYWVFSHFSLHVACALGRFAELLPAAICGYWLHVSLSSGYIKMVAVMSLGMIGTSLFFADFVCLGTSGFSYQGLPLLFLSVGISGLAIVVGDRIRSEIGMSGVRWLSDCMAGVYYVHLLVGKSLELLIGRQRGIFEASFVFALSLILVAVLNRVKWLKWCVK